VRRNNKERDLIVVVMMTESLLSLPTPLLTLVPLPVPVLPVLPLLPVIILSLQSDPARIHQPLDQLTGLCCYWLSTTGFCVFVCTLYVRFITVRNQKSDRSRLFCHTRSIQSDEKERVRQIYHRDSHYYVIISHNTSVLWWLAIWNWLLELLHHTRNGHGLQKSR